MVNKIYKFSEINMQVLEEIADFEQVRNREIFNDWFNFKFDINKYDEEFLLKLILANEYNIDFYLEFQLHFISPLLNKVYFYGKNYREWFHPEISGIVNGKILRGKSDFMVVSGDRKPKKPFFFLQEFKKQKTASDPMSQLIAQMSVAIEINKTNKMYGVYNIGRFWFFVVLEKITDNKYKYHESKAFDCLEFEHLKKIYTNLKAIKFHIQNEKF
ncbi:MAG: hypothetical protein B6I24_01070 [Bacteroidetes bacterium 4572_128]|nr:MAG: hypothetical protein B6I24_01070 [Bacteroidetes bacterium 4572_128]